MSRLVPITALIVLGTLSVARADVYRWVDDKGEPHYSDQWVPGSTIIKTSKVRPGADSTTSQPRSASAAGTPPVSDEANARAVKQDLTKSRDAQCKAAQDRYAKAIVSRR